MRPNLLILEGADYTGKSSNAELLRKQLEEKQHKVIVVRAPGGSPLSEKIRDIARAEAGSLEEQYLAYLLALVASKSYIEKLIDEGFTVILDRWADSLYAYQIGKEKEGPMRTLMFEMATKMLSFDDNIVTRRAILTIAPEVLEHRRSLAKQGKDAIEVEDRFDASGSRYRAGVVQAYDDIAAYEKTRSPNFLGIDANKDAATVSKQVTDFFLQSF